MIAALRNLFRPESREVAKPAAQVPAGERVYAVGDVHGRLDLFYAIARAIERDDAERNAAAGVHARTSVILLGDLIDRGPDSAGVLAAARTWQQHRNVTILMGNHEEMLLESLEKIEVLKHFVQHGGRETLLSFGLSEDEYTSATWEELQALARLHVPAETVEFLRSFGQMARWGDYVFVHAGIKPAVPLEAQSPLDTRWIREPFLSSPLDHGAVIVHGHTISDEPQLRANRIGIDTGAYASGRLTALVLEGDQRWWLTATKTDISIETATNPAC
jgi:serine/threonine protein phosphatase 1